MTIAERSGRADLSKRMADNLTLFEHHQSPRRPWRHDDPVGGAEAVGSFDPRMMFSMCAARGSVLAGLLGVLAGAMITLAACGSSRGTDANPPPTQAVLTFNRDIAPILYEHCGSCHRPARPADRAPVRTPGRTPCASPARRSACSTIATCASTPRRSRRRRGAGRCRRGSPSTATATFANERRLARRSDRARSSGGSTRAPSKATRPTSRRSRHWPKGWQLGEPDLVAARCREPYTLHRRRHRRVPQLRRPGAAARRRATCAAIEFRDRQPEDPASRERRRRSARASRASSIGATRSRALPRCPTTRSQNVYGWSPGKAPFMEPADRAWTLERRQRPGRRSCTCCRPASRK